MGLASTFYLLPEGVQRKFGWILRRAMFPKAYLSHSIRYRKFNALSDEEKKIWIYNKVKHLANHAQRHNKFYASHYKSKNFDANSLQCYEDLQRIPIVNKEILRKSKDKWIPSSSLGLRGRTAGTSGSPMPFAFDQMQVIKERFYISKIFEQIGCTERDTRLVFRGLSHMGESSWLYHPEGDCYLINTFKPFEEIKSDIVDLAYSKNIKYLHGFPSSIYQFAKKCGQNENTDVLNAIKSNLKGILLGSEFPAKVYLDEISKIFNVPTISWYGHSELVVFAAERTEPLEYYPFQSYGWCESIQQHKGRNHLAGTCYDNYLTPFIRYDTEDSIDVIDGNMGLLNSFSISQGRIGECVLDKNSHPVSLTALITARHHKAFDVADFVQISQERNGEAVIHVTSESHLPDNISELFDLKNVDIEFRFEQRNQPYRTKLGKLPLLIPQSVINECG